MAVRRRPWLFLGLGLGGTIALGIRIASYASSKEKNGDESLEFGTPSIDYEKMNALLRAHEENINPASPLVSRIDANSLGSNVPNEDRLTIDRFVHQSSSSSLLFGIFDGHAGGEFSHALQKRFPAYVARYSHAKESGTLTTKRISLAEDAGYDELASLKKRATTTSDDFGGEILRRVFVDLDDDLKMEILGQASTSPALVRDRVKYLAASGSCGLAAWIRNNDEVVLANTGDSRAVLGVRDSSAPSGYRAVALTKDQTVENLDEVERLAKGHPEEKTIIGGRLLGSLQPLRALGDFQYKLTERELKLTFEKWFVNFHPYPGYKTPPYLTAEPVITRQKLDANCAFLVLASDGLWDKLSNQEVIDAVVKQKEKGNVATHLIRRVLGGENDKSVWASLQLKPPFSRMCRDDVSIIVIFFDLDDKTLKLKPHL